MVLRRANRAGGRLRVSALLIAIESEAACGRERPALQQRDGSLDHPARIDQIGLQEPVVAVVLRLAQTDVDDAAHHAPVLGAEVAGVEVDLVEHLGRHDAGETAEVVDERHRRAVDERLRIGGAGAAHEEQAGDRGRARDTRQIL